MSLTLGFAQPQGQTMGTQHLLHQLQGLLLNCWPLTLTIVTIHPDCQMSTLSYSGMRSSRRTRAIGGLHTALAQSMHYIVKAQWAVVWHHIHNFVWLLARPVHT